MTITMGALMMVGLTSAIALTSDQSLMGEWNWPAGVAVACLGLFSTASAYLIYYRLLAQAGVVNTSLVSFLVPLSTLILGAAFLDERLDAVSLAGMSLILAGLAVLDGRVLKSLSAR